MARSRKALALPLCPVLVFSTFSALDALGAQANTRRTGPAPHAARSTLQACVQDAVRSTDLPWADCVTLDRDRDLVLLVPPWVPAAALLDPFIGRLDGVLRRQRALSSPDTAIRLCVAAHLDHLDPEGHRWIGSAVDTARRLLDVADLHTALGAADRSELALIVSDELYRAAAMWPGARVDPATFRAIAPGREQPVPAWIHVPGYRWRQTGDGAPVEPVDTGLPRTGGGRPAARPVPRQIGGVDDLVRQLARGVC